MPDDDLHFGKDVEAIVHRVAVLKVHADAVIDAKERAQNEYHMLFTSEVWQYAQAGLSPRAAEIGAANNLRLVQQEIEARLEMELRKLERLLRLNLE